MNEYRKIVRFYYNGNYYNMYLDNCNKHFFLKVDLLGNLSYISFEELVDLVTCFTTIPWIMNARRDYKNNKINFIPKVIIGGVSVVFSLSVLMTAFSMYQSQARIKNFENDYSSNKNISTEEIQDYIAIADSPDELIVDTYLESDLLKKIYIYDMDYLDKALNYDDVSIDEIKVLISKSNGVPEKFKNLMYEFCDLLDQKYPNIELRVLYENLKTLEVIECDKKELVEKSLSMDSYGCYIRSENKIYVLKDDDYKKQTWAYQIIFHEISHCLRTGAWDIDGNAVRVQVEGQNFNNTITAEVLNSLFTVSLFDYEENDIAYQLQSNYHKIILECIDNYSLEDYVNHSLSYYAKKLDEFNEDNNYATVIFELIQMQYNDYHNSSVKVEQSEYYPIYDYISDMYYRKYLNSDMSYKEAIDVTNLLLDKIMFDVPEDYNIDTNHFYDHLNEYCNSIGIITESKSK